MLHRDESGPAETRPFFSCAFFYDRVSDRVLLHLRDHGAPTNPGMWGFFGGNSEPGEMPAQCLARELLEELEFDVTRHAPKLLRSYVNPRSGRERHVFFCEASIDPETTPLHEGAGMRWLSWAEVETLPLTPSTLEDLRFFRDRVGRAGLASIFDRAADVYTEARPGYPVELYRHLEQHCGLGPHTRVLEVGAGSGQATLELLKRAGDVTAVEPGPALAGLLAERAKGQRLTIIRSTFEEADLELDAFDLLAAATAFHWIDPTRGIEKAASVLRGGGWLALWATIFGDRDRPDPFREKLERMLADRAPALLRTGPASEAIPTWATALEASDSFAPPTEVMLRWEGVHTPQELRALFASFSPWIALEDKLREATLSEVERIAHEKFGGRVRRPYRTVLRTARRVDT